MGKPFQFLHGDFRGGSTEEKPRDNSRHSTFRTKQVIKYGSRVHERRNARRDPEEREEGRERECFRIRCESKNKLLAADRPGTESWCQMEIAAIAAGKTHGLPLYCTLLNMPHVAASNTRADSAPPTRRSSRLARDSRRNNQSALRTDTNSGLSRNQAPLTPAHQPVPSRASTSPPQAYFGPNTQKATEASRAPAVSPGKETSPTVKPRGPVEAAEPPQPPPQPRPTDYSRFVPFIAGLSFLLGLAVPYLFASRPSGSATLQLHLEQAVPVLTHHVQLSASLLEHVQDFQTPLLDHSSYV